MISGHITNIWIFGDSFAASKHKHSWTKLLNGRVINRATNGSSEYRIWKLYQQSKSNIKPTDKIIFCHTSYSRVFLKNTVTELLSRLLPSHVFCDIILADIQHKQETKFIKILKSIWDDNYFYDNYKLFEDDLRRVPNSIHLNFFEDTSYRDVYVQHKGTINHMDQIGNLVIGTHLNKLL
jgi:hypothetical protein